MGKRSFLITAIVVLVLVPPAAEAAAMRVNWVFSGTALQNVAKADDSPTSVSGRATVFQVHAKGAPGAATLTGINQGFVSGDVIPADDDCFDGADFKFVGGVSENSIVALFNDLSVLNMIKDDEASGPSFGCYDIETARFDAIVQVNFNGGFGRFRNATGTATIRLTSRPVGFIDNGSGVVPSKLLSEVGTITGRLYR